MKNIHCLAFKVLFCITLLCTLVTYQDKSLLPQHEHTYINSPYNMCHANMAMASQLCFIIIFTN